MSLIARAAYGLEARLRRLQMDEPPFGKWRNLALYHASTPDHLAVFLEQVLHEHPELRIGVASVLNDVVRDLPEWQGLAAQHDLHPSVPERADGAILLHSPRAEQTPSLRRLKARFGRDKARNKVIIDGDASIWPGSTAGRTKRKFLRLALSQVAERRNLMEERLLRERLLPDPGYEEGEDTPPYPGDGGEGWRRLLDDPVPLEQHEGTGLVRRRLEQLPADADLYEEKYHALRFRDQRRNWQQDARIWQGRRWANMASVGLKEGAGKPMPRALDAGCGSGLLADLLHQRGYKVDAFDVSRTAIGRATGQFPHVRFLAGDLSDVELHPDGYDLITLSHVIEHILDDRDYLQRLGAHLKPEGKLYVETTWMDIEPLKARPQWVHQRDHFREHSKRSLWALLTASGYDVLSHGDSWREGDGEPYQFLLARLRS